MTTISVKIDKEDKLIMIKILENIKACPFDVDDFEGIIVYEMYVDMLSKFRASQHNSKAIRLNLAQARGFLSFLNVYKKVGDYELANACILSRAIKKEISKKVLSLQAFN